MSPADHQVGHQKEKQRFSSQLTRIALSLFVLFHLSVIVILANGSSYLGRSLQSYLIPYANFIGLNSTWNFFSPDPAHTMYFRYVVHFGDNEDGSQKEPVEEYIPPTKEQVIIDSSKRRLLYAMRFMMLDPKRVNAILGPWVCRQYAGATMVSIDHMVEQIPPLDRATMDQEEGAGRTLVSSSTSHYEFPCNQQGNEEIL